MVWQTCKVLSSASVTYICKAELREMVRRLKLTLLRVDFNGTVIEILCDGDIDETVDAVKPVMQLMIIRLYIINTSQNPHCLTTFNASTYS